MREHRPPAHEQPPGAQADGSDGPVPRLLPEHLKGFAEGSHSRLHEVLGAHAVSTRGDAGVRFAVWAPGAERVSVIGDFNRWEAGRHPLDPLGDSGVWTAYVPGVRPGAPYKYRVVSGRNGREVDKADPFAFRCQTPPETASIVWRLDHDWQDEAWMACRGRRSAADAPMSIYEMHLGSWKRPANGQLPGYHDLAGELIPYLKRTGFTHVEFLPPGEHPFYGSWGYQTTGYFAATARYGDPQQLMRLIDELHRSGIGVIFDWVPAHFPTDEHGLFLFDGTHLYEHADPKLGRHPDWNSAIFDYGRGEVCSFLISNALFWLDRYHVDGLRVDAVASMIYRDFSRKQGEWDPNEHGGRENLEAVALLRRLNDTIHDRFPEVRTIAEESTSWAGVSRPTQDGGLGFDMKWDLGWMHDTLEYLRHEPSDRRFHQQKLTFRILYAFDENFVLPLSHDEVVYGKGSLLTKMPGDDPQRFATLRALFATMFAQPGKKLLFMGAEFGQRREWHHDRELDWELLQSPRHAALQRFVADLNRVYREEPALHQLDFSPAGFQWVDCSDAEQSVICFLRRAARPDDAVLAVCNFALTPHPLYRVGVPSSATWREILNSDATRYGGSGQGNPDGLAAAPSAFHGFDHSISLTLPALSVVLLKPYVPTPE